MRNSYWSLVLAASAILTLCVAQADAQIGSKKPTGQKPATANEATHRLGRRSIVQDVGSQTHRAMSLEDWVDAGCPNDVIARAKEKMRASGHRKSSVHNRQTRGIASIEDWIEAGCPNDVIERIREKNRTSKTAKRDHVKRTGSQRFQSP